MGLTDEEMIRQLQEMFPNKPISTIQYIMDIVNKSNPLQNDDYKFETAFDLLTDGGNGNGEVELYDEAVGGELPHLENLIQIFPDCQPNYLRTIIRKHENNFNFDVVVDELSLSEIVVPC